MARNRTAGRLSATTDIAAAFAGNDLSIICVGTPGEADGAIGLSQVRALSATIGAALAEKTGFHRVMT
ncbi:hypothetical protein TM49_12720 [Martelella endophytica]|uniref:UDP-glucose/GDP-mannose dehydrogenase N-terminal domain-containing protein n=1 Tax=Martelella endophytica TaxID=1486262 RepID=A0A0D5LSI3_MAREN|nr:hypothetical protein TM49_12720 [Martelella endophytica]